MQKRKTHKQFEDKANQIHNNKYTYPEQYSGSRSKISIICPNHGVFQQMPYSHLSGCGCHKCDVETRAKNNTLTHELFVKKANKQHDSKYTYPEEYVHSQTLIEIRCPIHGTFNQLPYVHLLGSECPKCANLTHIGGYSDKYFDQFPNLKDIPAVLYVIILTRSINQSFIKVGISVNLKERFYRYTRKGLSYKIVETHMMNLYNAWVKEQRILKKLNSYRYFPNIVFEGYTECFKHKRHVLEKIHEYCLIQSSERIEI